jgi:hypothetical protein
MWLLILFGNVDRTINGRNGRGRRKREGDKGKKVIRGGRKRAKDEEIIFR